MLSYIFYAIGLIFIQPGLNIQYAYRNLSINHPVKDSFVLIKQSKIYYKELGNGTPVVFVSGLGDDHETWQTVQDSTAQYALTLSYDRSGLGKSEYHHESKDLTSMVQELNNVLTALSISKPFILVGHSLGCQVVKAYAVAYPRNIKGILFIDPGYNEDSLKAQVSDSLWEEREKALKKYLPVFSIAQNEELKNVNKSAAISDSMKNVPRIPIILLTATHINPDFPCSKQELEVKEKSHALWLQTMPTAVHKFVRDSRHYIQNDDPQVVINEIKALLQQ